MAEKTRTMTKHSGIGAIPNAKGVTFHMAMGNELIIYEMHVGTFHVKEQGHPGTLDSATEKLPYLQQLGINAVEVMPIMEFYRQLFVGLQSVSSICC